MKKIYEKRENEILVTDLSDFCIKHILECGQIFRFKRLIDLENNGVKYAYVVFSLNKKATILEYENFARILTDEVDYFANFFDLDTDYSIIKNELLTDKTLKLAVNYGYGIRILKQDFLETLISFIISSNNNILRIQKSLNLISERFGDFKQDYYAFPTLNQLEKITKQDFRNCGVGFRDTYLVETIASFKNFNIEELYNSKDKQKTLMKFKGVGPKVADCILLFGLHDMMVFPVDTWIKKVYNTFYANDCSDDTIKIREFFLNKFKNYSGYAQQYLFYYKRELDKLKI